jgi:uncharacterized lipoprotein YddW (UPF0748 family)
MNKRQFIKNTAAVVAGSCVAGLLPSCATIRKPGGLKQKNWAWTHPHTNWTRDQWLKKLSQAKNAGIDAILVEVYNGTDTYYSGGQLPMKFDIFELLIPLCQSIDIEVHAWMWTMPCNAPDIISKHPDWYAYNRLGQPSHLHPAYVPYYKFLCPCHPEVQDFVKGNVTSLSKISEIKGVHLDYVRLPDVILAEGLQPTYHIVQDKEYPEYDYCYSPLCRSQFKVKTGLDPLVDIKDPATHTEWIQFRRDSITHLVNNVLVPEAKKYDKQITAAVFPNWEHVRQEWHSWHLDGFLPMLYHNFYNRDLDFIKEHTEKAIMRLHNSKPVYSGLFVPSISPENIKQAKKMAKEGGSAGCALFDLSSMTDAHWQAFK